MTNRAHSRNFLTSRAAILTLILFTLIGAHLGAEYHVRSDRRYVTQAVVRIEPKLPMILGGYGCFPGHEPPATEEYTNHASLIASTEAITTCLQRYPELKGLNSLKQVPAEQLVTNILRHMTVTVDREDPYIYDLNFHSGGQSDGARILESLIKSYRKTVEDKTESENKTRASQLKKEPDEQYRKTAKALLPLNGFRFNILVRPKTGEFSASRFFRCMFWGGVIACFASVVLLKFMQPGSAQLPDSNTLNAQA